MKFGHVLGITAYEYSARVCGKVALKPYFKTKLLCSFGNWENSFANKWSQLNRDDTKAYVNNVFSDSE